VKKSKETARALIFYDERTNDNEKSIRARPKHSMWFLEDCSRYANRAERASFIDGHAA